MPGTNAGTGQPLSFECWRCRQSPCRDWRGHSRCSHRQTRTGKTRPYKGGNRGPRGLMEHHEYVCECGHRGWSRHNGVLRLPVEVV